MMIGERLAKARKAAGLTQQQMADLLGLNYKAISAYERELYEPDDQKKKVIAERVNMSLDYLLGVTDEALKLDKTNHFALPDDFPEAAKADLKEYAELLMLKYKQKIAKK